MAKSVVYRYSCDASCNLRDSGYFQKMFPRNYYSGACFANSLFFIKKIIVIISSFYFYSFHILKLGNNYTYQIQQLHLQESLFQTQGHKLMGALVCFLNYFDVGPKGKVVLLYLRKSMIWMLLLRIIALYLRRSKHRRYKEVRT